MSNKSFDAEKAEQQIDVVPVRSNEDGPESETVQDAVFGELSDKGPNYRNVCP